MTRLRSYDLVHHLAEQREWSEATFGPGNARDRAPGIIAHIKKELEEIGAEPTKLEEWLDVAILAFEGAWRTGAAPAEIAAALAEKMEKNRARTWPDWRTVKPGQPIEHVRGEGE